MNSDDDLINALKTIKATFDSLGIEYYIGGSVASSFHGAMRSTNDVDIVAELNRVHLNLIMAGVKDEYYASESAMHDAIERRSSFNLIHLPTSFKVDVFVSRDRPFERSSLKRSSLVRLGTPDHGIDVPLASVEDTLLAKLEWYRTGNEVSERQWDDVSRLLKINHAAVDWDYLNSTADDLQVGDLLERLRWNSDNDFESR